MNAYGVDRISPERAAYISMLPSTREGGFHYVHDTWKFSASSVVKLPDDEQYIVFSSRYVSR